MLKKWQNDWGLVTNIIRVTRYRERLNSSQESTQEVHYYVSNRLLPVEKYARAIRQHWYIENKLHHVKDVAFQEDRGLRRVNPALFSTCIDFALNRLRYSGELNIKGKLYEISLNIKNLLNNEKLML
jgi:predicted transposase YbfD/YdcC